MGRQVARDHQGRQVVIGNGERQLRGLRCEVPLRQRRRPRADVLRPVPRRLGNRGPRGDSQGAPTLLLLLVRSTVWALTSPSRGEVGPGITEVTAATSAQLAEAMGAEGDLVAARLSRGCRCFGAWAGDELLGYAWLSTGPEWIGEVD